MLSQHPLYFILCLLIYLVLHFLLFQIMLNSFGSIDFTPFLYDHYVLLLPQDQQFKKQFQYNLLRDYKGNYPKQVPIIRLFGSIERTKTCAHVHGYFPYFHVKAGPFQELMRSDSYLIEWLQAIQNCYRTIQKLKAEQQIIFNYERQNKLDYYGYHSQQELFIKIYLYSDKYIPLLRKILQHKLVNRFSFQVYGAHINYFMHFFQDMNIYGMHDLSFQDFTIRKRFNIKAQQQSRKLNSSHQIQTAVTKINSLAKSSSCYLQIDVYFKNIVNYYFLIINDRSGSFTVKSQQQKQTVITVETTKSLKQFWIQEQQRRNNQKLADLSSLPPAFNPKSNPIDISFSKQFNYLEPICNKNQYQVSKAVQIDTDKLFNFNNYLQSQKQDLSKSYLQRVHYYGVRAKQSVLNRTIGSEPQLPQWSDQESASQISFQAQNQQDSQITVTYTTKSAFTQIMSQSNRRNATALWRGNFTVKQASLDLKEPSQSQTTLLFLQIKQGQVIQGGFFYQFLQNPPGFDQVISSTFPDIQQIFFEPQDFSQVMGGKGFGYAQKADKFSKGVEGRVSKSGLRKDLKLPEFYRLHPRQQLNYICDKQQMQSQQDFSLNFTNKQSYFSQFKFQEIKSTLVGNTILTRLYVEVLPRTNLILANPDQDPVLALFMLYKTLSQEIQLLVLISSRNPLEIKQIYGLKHDNVFVVRNQEGLCRLFLLLVYKLDPDLLISYDMQKKGFFYLAYRAFEHGLDLCYLASRAYRHIDSILVLK